MASFLGIYLVAACLVINVVSSGDCPDGFENHQGTCYFFSHGKETWTGAYDSCVILGGHLVEVNDVVEDRYLSGRSKTFGDYFWIGLEDKAVEGEYVWASSHISLEPDAYTNWGYSEPDGLPNENCVVYAPSRNYQWADATCTQSLKYICEKSANEPIVVG